MHMIVHVVRAAVHVSVHACVVHVCMSVLPAISVTNS